MREVKWLKSSFSEASGNACVELATTGEGIALRESESPAHVLAVDRAALGALIRQVKAAPQTTGAPRHL